jgi:hypothetical protein
MTTRREDDEGSEMMAPRERASTMIGRAVQEGVPDPPPPAGVSTNELVEVVMRQVRQLAQAQLALAKTDLRAELLAEMGAAKGLGFAAVAAFAAVNLLLVTGVIALGLVMPAWLAGLIVSGVLVVAAVVVGIVGWRKRVRRPLRRPRRAIPEDLQWTFERMV